MADLPRTDNCPINENGICTCFPTIRCNSVASAVCDAIRVAYCYGCNKTESEMLEKIRGIKEGIDDLFHKNCNGN